MNRLRLTANEFFSGKRLFVVVTLGLVAYSIVLTYLTGDIGFEGDDWWVLSRAYWNPFPHSIVVYAQDFLRPIEGVYWMSLFHVLGFNRPPFFLLSHLLLVWAAVVFGLCVYNAFPKRRGLAVLSSLFAFFIPMTACLTYVMCTDNSRLSLALFWTSVLAFRRGLTGSRISPWFFVGFVLYVLAFFTYEAPAFLILTLPFFLWSTYTARYPDQPLWRFVMVTAAAAVGMIVMVAVVRSVFLGGGAVERSHFIPPLNLIASYWGLIPFYVAAPFTEGRIAPIALATVAVALAFGVILWRVRRSPTEESFINGLVILGLGLLIIALGAAPYQLAGYGVDHPSLSETVAIKWGLSSYGVTNWFNFNWSSRIYSAAGFGVALILAFVCVGWRAAWVKKVGTVCAGMLLFGFVAFHSELRTDWRAAADMRRDIVQSLLEVAPALQPGSNLAVLDLECEVGHAPVFRGWGGLRDLVRMLYNEPKLNAWYIYPRDHFGQGIVKHQALATPKGFVTRGVPLEKPAPHDSLVLLRRTGDHLTLLDEISAGDGLVFSGVKWQGCSSIHTTRKRVRVFPQGSCSVDPHARGSLFTCMGFGQQIADASAVFAAPGKRPSVGTYSPPAHIRRIYGRLLNLRANARSPLRPRCITWFITKFDH